jgi:hypothetical protein
LHAFKIGVDDLDQVSHIAQNFPISPGSSWNSQWSPFSALGNRAKYMTVAQHADGRLHAFMIGMDNQMWHNEQNTSGWGGWNILSSSGDRAKSLVATRDDDNRLHAFAIGIGRSPWIDVSLMLPERNSSNGGGRWYPTPVTLPDGRVAVMGGHPGSLDSRHSNYMVEVFDPLLNQWTDAGDEPGAVINKVSTDPEIYPRLHVLPDGNVFCVLLADDVSYKWNPQAKQFSAQTTPAMAVTEMRFQNNSSKNRWTSVLLPLRPQDGYHPRVLAAGGMQLAYVLDVNAPQNGWQATQPRVGSAPLRKYASLVLTPDGKVLMIGGTRGGPPPQNLDDNDATQAVREVEQFDPVTGTWTTLAAAAVPRQYHSTALLLPDGRVWTGGSNPNDSGSREERMEVFSPPYLFKGDRPIIASAPDVIKWNTNFEIHSPDAASITRVVVIRCGSATHGFDSDQRFIQLSIQGPVSNIGILVKAPPHGMIAPPGYYMLFVLTANDVPSHAVIVRCAG